MPDARARAERRTKVDPGGESLVRHHTAGSADSRVLSRSVGDRTSGSTRQSITAGRPHARASVSAPMSSSALGDGPGLGAVPAGHRGDVHVADVDPGRPVERAGLVQRDRAVEAVAEHDGGERHVVADGRLELLARHQEPAVPGEDDDLARRIRQLGADAARDAVPHRAAGRARPGCAGARTASSGARRSRSCPRRSRGRPSAGRPPRAPRSRPPGAAGPSVRSGSVLAVRNAPCAAVQSRSRADPSGAWSRIERQRLARVRDQTDLHRDDRADARWARRRSGSRAGRSSAGDTPGS